NIHRKMRLPALFVRRLPHKSLADAKRATAKRQSQLRATDVFETHRCAGDKEVGPLVRPRTLCLSWLQLQSKLLRKPRHHPFERGLLTEPQIFLQSEFHPDLSRPSGLIYHI